MNQTFKINQEQYNKVVNEFAMFQSHGMEIVQLSTNSYMLIIKWDKIESFDYEWNKSHKLTSHLKWLITEKFELKGL